MHVALESRSQRGIVYFKKMDCMMSTCVHSFVLLTRSQLPNPQHFMWTFARSDPYHAYSYDSLHSDELGKWAHHLWPLVKDTISTSGWSSKVNEK